MNVFVLVAVVAGVLVEASGDVTVHVLSVSDWSTGSYFALPLDKLGTDHYVITSPFSSNQTRASWQVSVISLVDNTVVRLSSSSGQLRPVDVGIDFASSFVRSTSATLLLHRYQTFQVIARYRPMLYACKNLQ